MFKTATASAIVGLSLFAATAASANDKQGVYVTIGGTLLSSELDLTELNVGGEVVDLGTEDANITMINGRLGYRLNDFFAVEGELGFGLGGDDFDRNIPVDVLGSPVNVDTNVTLDVKNYYIAFARGILPVSDQFDVFARVGYGEATAEAEAVGTFAGFTAAGEAEQDEAGFAYGVGAQYNFTANDGIRADYTRLEDTNIISLAYSRRF
jgi:opacity protein-like surface antigen